MNTEDKIPTTKDASTLKNQQSSHPDYKDEILPLDPEPADTPIEGFDIKLDQEKLKRIDRLVDDYEDLIASRIDQAYVQETTWSEKLADKIALFGGSWRFISIFGISLIAWILWNTFPLDTNLHFDPAPFILLNLLLSLLAAFQAPIIMMSQNRQAARDKRESIIDFAINYKSEFEINDIQTQLTVIRKQLKKMDRKLSHIETVQSVVSESSNDNITEAPTKSKSQKSKK